MLRNTWKQLSSRLSNLQSSRPERHALLNYLWQDLSTGFNPCFMLTYHSKAPAEQGCSLQRPPLSSALNPLLMAKSARKPFLKGGTAKHWLEGGWNPQWFTRSWIP